MLLGANIDNKFISLGVFDENDLILTFKIKSDVNRSADELAFLIKYLIKDKNIALDEIDDIIASSVVPEMTFIFECSVKILFNKKAIFVGTGIKTGLDIKCESPKEVGSDRVTMAVGALDLVPGPLLIINMASVTTIDMINNKNQFIGGLIFPGIDLLQEVLRRESAKLPNVEITLNETVIGNSTTSAMISGLYRAYINACKGIVNDIVISKNLKKDKLNIVLTGNFSSLLETMDNYRIFKDDYLIFNGLKRIYDLNINNNRLK